LLQLQQRRWVQRGDSSCCAQRVWMMKSTSSCPYYMTTTDHKGTDIAQSNATAHGGCPQRVHDSFNQVGRFVSTTSLSQYGYGFRKRILSRSGFFRSSVLHRRHTLIFWLLDRTMAALLSSSNASFSTAVTSATESTSSSASSCTSNSNVDVALAERAFLEGSFSQALSLANRCLKHNKTCGETDEDTLADLSKVRPLLTPLLLKFDRHQKIRYISFHWDNSHAQRNPESLPAGNEHVQVSTASDRAAAIALQSWYELYRLEEENRTSTVDIQRKQQQADDSHLGYSAWSRRGALDGGGAAARAIHGDNTTAAVSTTRIPQPPSKLDDTLASQVCQFYRDVTVFAKSARRKLSSEHKGDPTAASCGRGITIQTSDSAVPLLL
jgi:hypothetical protein